MRGNKKLASVAIAALAATAFAACGDDEEDNPTDDSTEMPTDTMMEGTDMAPMTTMAMTEGS